MFVSDNNSMKKCDFPQGILMHFWSCQQVQWYSVIVGNSVPFCRMQYLKIFCVCVWLFNAPETWFQHTDNRIQGYAESFQLSAEESWFSESYVSLKRILKKHGYNNEMLCFVWHVWLCPQTHRRKTIFLLFSFS